MNNATWEFLKAINKDQKTAQQVRNLIGDDKSNIAKIRFGMIVGMCDWKVPISRYIHETMKINGYHDVADFINDLNVKDLKKGCNLIFNGQDLIYW